MEPIDDRRLRRRARWAYERGRLRAALTCACLTGAPALLALSTFRRPGFSLELSAVIFAVVAFLVWRGRESGRGAVRGLWAGTIPLMALVLARSVGESLCGTGFCFAASVPICFAAGIAAGAYVVWRAVRSRAPLSYWASAGIVASLTAALGCVPIGLGASLGLAAGFLLVSLPAAVAVGAATR